MWFLYKYIWESLFYLEPKERDGHSYNYSTLQCFAMDIVQVLEMALET